MKLYIQNFCSISPAGVWASNMDDSQLSPLPPGFSPSVEPDYTPLIPAMQLRRMSKPIRLGMAAAKICLGVHTHPGSIHIGTAYGNLADSEKFLQNLIVQEEQTLTPTAFIQSTHNTVSGQIALALSCNAHNMTFVHRAHSFESAFIDAGLHLKPQTAAYALLGSVDECTPIAYETLSRMKAVPEGIAQSEGAAFFQVSASAEKAYLACVAGMLMFQSHDQQLALERIKDFVTQNGGPQSAVIYGVSSANDMAQIVSDIFPDVPNASFKKYSGSYPTAASFGLAMSISWAQKYARCWLINNEGSYWSVWLVTN